MTEPPPPGGRAAEERGGQSRPLRHLITGVAGQDGILLARQLLASGEHVVGTATQRDDARLATYLPGVRIEELDVRSTSTFADLVREHRPDVVHNLAALSSVGASWDQPELTDEVNHRAVLGMLSVIGEAGISFVQASSSEIFGPHTPPPAQGLTEDTPLNPVSPYAEAKARAHTAVAEARASGARATNLILFGHTSPLHDAKFVLPTITRQAADVAMGRLVAIELRDPSVARDWGSAADFVRAFALAAHADLPPVSADPSPVSGDLSPVLADTKNWRQVTQHSRRVDDYVIATGRLHQLGDVAEWALTAAHADPSPVSADPSPVSGDLSPVLTDTKNWRQVTENSRQVGVRASGDPARPNDFGGVVGDPSRAATELGWRPTISLRETIEQMVRADLARLRTGVTHSPAHLV